MNAVNRLGGFIFLMVALISGCKDEDAVKGDQLFQKGRYEEAIAAYNEYLELNPSHIKSIYNRGRAYEELGQYDKALASFKEVLDIDEKNTAALMSVGQHYYRENDYPNAVFYLDKAVTVDNSNARAFFLLGRSYHLQGMVREAMEAYDSAISLNDNLGEAYLYRGALKAHLNRMSAACNDFKMAKSLEVRDADEALSRYCN